MEDIESSVSNPWPVKWWRVLSKMDFLKSVRYKEKSDLYLLVCSQIATEIERCSAIEERINLIDQNICISKSKSMYSVASYSNDN